MVSATKLTDFPAHAFRRTDALTTLADFLSIKPRFFRRQFGMFFPSNKHVVYCVTVSTETHQDNAKVGFAEILSCPINDETYGLFMCLFKL